VPRNYRFRFDDHQRLSAIAAKYVIAIPKANGLLLGGSHVSSAAATQQVDDEVQESRFASWHASGKTTAT